MNALPKIKISHAAVKVKNVSSSLEFLTKVLGVKPAWSQDDWGMVKSEGTTLALIEEKQEVHPPHIGFVVDQKEDVDFMYEHLKASGAKNIEAPRDHRDKSRSFYFQDPDGNQFELLWLPDNLTH